MALKNGIDLVLELPALYASQTAELFSAGAIQLLHMTGLVTHIAFGSEHNNIEESGYGSQDPSRRTQRIQDVIKIISKQRVFFSTCKNEGHTRIFFVKMGQDFISRAG